VISFEYLSRAIPVAFGTIMSFKWGEVISIRYPLKTILKLVLRDLLWMERFVIIKIATIFSDRHQFWFSEPNNVYIWTHSPSQILFYAFFPLYF
jgi:hypothetical protein